VCQLLNKSQSNLAKGDIAPLIMPYMQMKSCRYLLSYSSGGSTRREVDPEMHLGPPCDGMEGRQQGTIRKREGDFL